MGFEFQKYALEELQSLANSDSHSILISGLPGIGKTYLASKYAKMLGIDIFNTVAPKVGDLKETIESSMRLHEPQVVCIENLDTGSGSSSQTILKYLEEPMPYTYIIVTCVNTSRLPSTILSRTLQVNLRRPTYDDLYGFGHSINPTKLTQAASYHVFECARTLSDIQYLLRLSVGELQYYDSLISSAIWKDSSDKIIWNLGHFNGGTAETDLHFVFLNILKHTNNPVLYKHSLRSLQSLESKRMSKHAILGRFVLDVKYGRG